MGCHRRLLDAQKISDYLKMNGFKIVKNPSRADYIILNTCAFKKSQEDFAIKKIEEFKKQGKKLIVGGCLPAINKERLGKVFGGPVFTTTSIDKLDDIFNPEIKFQELPDTNKMFMRSILLDPAHFRDIFRIKFLTFFLRNFHRVRGHIWSKDYYIRISWGCLGKCSYCGIKNAIGLLKSKSIQECLDEFKKGISQGYRSFTFIADELGSYGLDIETTFPALLKEFLKIEGNYKFYFLDLNPHWIIKYLNELIPIIKTGKVVEIACPVQSGSNKILKLMNRPNKAEEIRDALNKVRKAYPKLIITTQIIVGFPGETEEDFDKTIKLVKDINADYTSLYPYSERPNTSAVSLPHKVSQEIIRKRIKKAKKRGI